MAITAFNGVETGSLSEFSVTGTGQTVTTGARTGGGGNFYLSNASSSTIGVTTNVDTAGTVFFAQLYFMMPNITAPATAFYHSLIDFVNTGGTVNMVVRLSFTTSGFVALQVVNSAGTQLGTQNITLVANQWYCIAAQCTNTGLTTTSGSCTVKLDNVSQASLAFSAQSFGTTNTSQIRINRSVTAHGYVVNTDDLVVDNAAYPSYGATVIARGPKSGTPTYNAFTKSNASTIDTVWNDTPTVTTTNATAAASLKQSGLIASFSATQTSTQGTSRGSGTIQSTDTIISLKTGVVAKSSVAASDQIITRLAAVDTLSTVAVTTADTYLQTPAITAPTLANLNAMEAGFSTGTTVATRTVEDLWVQVVYLYNAVAVIAKGATLMMMGV